MEEVKGYRSAIDDSVNEFICPISLDLPLDPVTAEDGRIYERESIAAHIASQGAALRSPVTNEPMGPRLFPSKQARNLIERMMRSGAITGDTATRWTERIEDEKKVANLERRAEVAELADEALVTNLRRKAEGGDAEALYILGGWHSRGEHGLTKSCAAAFRWYKRASDLHHVKAMAVAGYMTANGQNVARNETFGVALTARAAEGGSDYAAHSLGVSFASGKNGLPHDDAQAMYWLSKVVIGDCPVKHIGDVHVREAAALLEEVRARARGRASAR